ncbi:unnamed protein product [Leptidea sinapis]|uniref:Uncharacterized protein n=1 Tax=Leptidea sinapis TaxID=189913 RepID=A0A5E4PPJ9_9NEOP|nr:unnamed protein product [Leptidea sinapis]
MIETIGNKISEITAEDKYDAFGKNVAHKLRSLPTNQRLLAEKIIIDALFEAEMGNLNRQCFLHIPTQTFPTSHSQKLQPLSSQVLNIAAREPFILQPPTQRFVHKTQPSTQKELNFQARESLILQQPTQTIVHTTQPSTQQELNFQAREPLILQPSTQTIVHTTQASTQQELNFHTREYEEESQVHVHIPEVQILNDAQTFYITFSVE